MGTLKPFRRDGHRPLGDQRDGEGAPSTLRLLTAPAPLIFPELACQSKGILLFGWVVEKGEGGTDAGVQGQRPRQR